MRNSIWRRTDGQTQGQVQVLSCAFAAKNFKKVEKSCFSQCPGFLQLTISAIGFSPNWVNLEPTYSFCLAHKGLNSPKSCTVGQSTTILYCWEPLGASLDQFGPLWSDLRA